jgi:hypothetical protein
MFAPPHHFKVVRPVVVALLVPVVDFFPVVQRPAEHGLGDKDVLEDAASRLSRVVWRPLQEIAIGMNGDLDGAATLVCCRALVPAGSGAELTTTGNLAL